MYICSLCCRFLESRLENIFSLNNLLILTFVIEVFLVGDFTWEKAYVVIFERG
jgi:hypothetical protein